MKKNTKNAFTLVELLAVIVILAIILVIAVPKVMNVIEDSKKATLESTAKMIASSAEKQKVQNTVLGNTNAITCDSVAKINKGDYASCSIEFENNTAKVTIEGAGKFDNLWVCGGDKTTAIAQDSSCPIAYGVGSTYIKNLLAKEEELNNGLVQTSAEYNGITYDAGIRYVGEMDEVKNKVYYNCEDTDANGVAYGETNYDYVNSCEVWRIIGVFDTKSSTNNDAVPRVKIINTVSTFKASWDSSASSINQGYGINEWSQSDLKGLLNGYYIGVKNATCTYCNGYKQATCEQTCTSESLKSAKMKILTNTAKGMIENAVWDTYGVKIPDEGSAVASWAGTAYLQEKGISAQNNGKNLCVEANGSDYSYCNDNIERTTSWTGLVGLMSIGDITYADGWLYSPSGTALFPNSISSFAHSGFTGSVWFASDVAASYGSLKQSGVFPSVYLSPNIKIIAGNVDTEPYILAE